MSDVSLLHLDWLCGEYPSLQWEAVARWYPDDSSWSVASQRKRALTDWPATRNFLSASPVRAARLAQGLEDQSFNLFAAIGEPFPVDSTHLR
jgi:hypothetical protein